MNQPRSLMENKRVLQVTNITHSASESDLADLFSVAGDVARATIIQSGFPYYGFVEYHQDADAKRGLMFNGKFFGTSKIVVDYSSQPFPDQPLLGNVPQPNPNSRMIRTTKTPQERASLSRMISTTQPPQQDNTVPMGFSNHSRMISTTRPPPQDDMMPMSLSNTTRMMSATRPPPQDDMMPRSLSNTSRMMSATRPPPQDDMMPRSLSNHNENNQTVQLNPPVNNTFQSTSFEVILSNIPVSLKEHNILQMFSQFGSVVDVKIALDTSNLSTGRGKVAFSSYESALNASSAMNGKQLGGSNLRLGCEIKAPNKSLAVQQGPGPMRDLRQSMSSSNNNIRHHPYNNVPHQQQPQNNPQSMHYQGAPANQQMHQHFDEPNMGGTNMSGYSMGRPNMGQQSSFNVHGGATHQLTASPNAPVEQQQPAAIYVGNLPETSCKNCLLYQLFAPYGAICSVKAMEPKGESKDKKTSNWFGFVNFKDIKTANVAILTLDKSSLDGQILKVSMKTEKPNTRKSSRFNN